jgi:two-component system sensor histidine kinase UhpB
MPVATAGDRPISAPSGSRQVTTPVRAGAAQGGLAHALWQGRSVRAQLLIVFVVIDVIAALVAGAVTILKARTATGVEIAASMETARLLIGEAVGLMRQEVPAERFLADLSSQLRLVRHVRIGVKDAAGHPLAVPGTAAPRTDDRAEAPRWFAALIASPVESKDVPVIVNGQRIGTVEIVPEPRDEIAEVWENTVALAWVALLVNVAVIAMLYVLFGRVLDPLTAVVGGLADLEHRKFGVRLSRPLARELAAITDRFNALAEALETARAENQRLNERLITAQDDERRRTALELHDEVGPSLFGLKANIGSVAMLAKDLPGDAAAKIVQRAGDLQAIVEHLQAVNRSMLNRLRPMALGHVPLRDLVAELVNERAAQNGDIAFSFADKGLARSYGDSIDLTVYRCVQESLTNVIKHAGASRVDVAIAQRPEKGGPASGDGGAWLELTVRDDGRGIAPGVPMGFGMRGMQERVQGLGGSYAVGSNGGRGAAVEIAIPLREGGGSA